MGAGGTMKRKTTISELTCPECGTVMFVPRRLSKKRERGHVKTMWCPTCKKKTDHIEGGSND